MPYSAPFVQVTCKGRFGTPAPGLEQWSTGFKVSSLGGGSFDPSNLLAYLTAIAPAISTFHSNTNLKSGTSCFLTDLTAAYVGTDGLYVGGSLQPTTVYTYGSPVAGSSGSTAPFSQALVLTFKSIILRGPASHGRMFWPATGLTCATGTGLVAATEPPLIATAAQAMLNSINAAGATRFGSGSNVSLMSKVNDGRQSPVITVAVGARLDTQERRERNLSESYAVRNLTLALAAREELDDQLDDIYDQERRDRTGERSPSA